MSANVAGENDVLPLTGERTLPDVGHENYWFSTLLDPGVCSRAKLICHTYACRLSYSTRGRGAHPNGAANNLPAILKKFRMKS